MLALGASLVSCADKNEYHQNITYQSGDFVVGKSVMVFGNDAQSTSLSIKAQSTPSVVSNSDWITISAVEQESANIYSCTVSAASNPSYTDRTGTITVTAAGQSETINVTQTGNPTVLIVSAPTDNLSAEAGTFSITYGATGDVTVTTPSWVKQESSRSYDESVLNFSYYANNTGELRTGEIVIALADNESVSQTVALTQAYVERQATESRTAVEIASSIYSGVNIGNTLEATGGETAWGAPKINTDYIHGIKEAGFNAVRIPVAWSDNMSADNVIDASWMARVREVVDYCLAEDLYVVLNDHWDSGWLENDIPNGYKEEKAARLEAMWTQISEQFADCDQRLMFAGLNEPNAENSTHAATLTQYEQVFIDAVRATGGNNLDRVLVVQGPSTNIDSSVNFWNLPTDAVADRLMVEVHYYDPWQFTGLEADASWGKVWWFWGADNHVEGSDRNATWGEESYVDAQMGKMYTKFASKNIPVILGEYAAFTSRSGLTDEEKEMNLKSRAYWNEYVSMTAKNNGCVPFYWECSGDIFNRNNGSITNQQLLDGIMAGSAAGTYPF